MSEKAARRTGERLKGEWHKVCGLLMAKMKQQHVLITLDDIRNMPDEQCLLAEETADGLHIQLVDRNVVPLLVAQVEAPLQ